MRTDIDSYEDLCAEERKLRQQLKLRRARLRDDYKVLQEKLAPVEKVAGIIKNVTTPSTRNPLVNTGINLAIDTVLRGFYSSKAGWLSKIVVPFILKNVSSNLVNKKGKSIFKSFKSLFGKNGKNGKLKEHHH